MSVTRVVMVKLDAAHATEAARREVAKRSVEAIRAVPGVEGVQVGVPADEKTAGAWDLEILVRLPSIADVAPYLAHPTHRAYVDAYLAPKMAAIKAWNFEQVD